MSMNEQDLETEAQRHNCTPEEYALLKVERKPGVVARVARAVVAPLKILDPGLVGLLGAGLFGASTFGLAEHLDRDFLEKVTYGGLFPNGVDAPVVFLTFVMSHIMIGHAIVSGQSERPTMALFNMVLMGSTMVSILWLVLAVPAFGLPIFVGIGMNGFQALTAEVVYGAMVFVGIPVSVLLNSKISGSIN